jgi:hypothetical protein
VPLVKTPTPVGVPEIVGEVIVVEDCVPPVIIGEVKVGVVSVNGASKPF